MRVQVILLLTISVILPIAWGCGDETSDGIPADTTKTTAKQDSVTVSFIPDSSTAFGAYDSLLKPRTVIPWQEAEFQSWTSLTSGNVVLYYPPTHQHAADMGDAVAGYANAVRTVCTRLGVPIPEDTIRVYNYTGPGHGPTVTGHLAPYGDSLAVHYSPSYTRGVSLTQHLLYRCFGKWSAHPIVNHGLIALFDFSGTNYHSATLDYVRNKQFIPLSNLAADPEMNSTWERYQSAEAASFVAFVMATRGPATLRALYDAPPPFESAAMKTFNISVDSLQAEWIAFVEATVNPIDTTKQGS